MIEPQDIRFPIFFVLIFLSTWCFAQSWPDPSNWTAEQVEVIEQFSSNSGKDFTQDSDGHLWIGSNNGIGKYDGYSIKSYLAEKGDTTSISHNRTSYLFTDHLGQIWVGTISGINRYLPDCDCFKQYSSATSPPNTVPEGEVNWIIEDHKKQLWVVSQHGGLYRYDSNKDLFDRFLYRAEDPVDLSKDQIRVIMEDNDGWIWIGTGEPFVPSMTGGGLIRFHPEKGIAKRYRNDPMDNHSIVDDRVSAFLQDKNGDIWVGTCEGEIHLYDPDQDHFIRMSEQENPRLYAPQIDFAPWSACPHIRVLKEDNQGGIWVGNFNAGIHRFDSINSSKPPRLFKQDLSAPTSFKNDLVWNFFEDHQGRFWVGNMDGGIVKIDPFKDKFKVYLKGNNISALYESTSEPGILWVGIWEEGVFRLDLSTGKHWPVYPKTKRGEPLPSKNIFGFLEDQDGLLWIVHDAGTSSYDLKTEELQNYFIENEESPGKNSITIYRIMEDRDGILWLGSWGDGLYRFDKSQGVYQRFDLPTTPGKKPGSYNQSVYALHQAANGDILVGTWFENLLLLDPKTLELETLMKGSGVIEIREYAPNRFWLGSNGNGLIDFSLEEGVIQSFNDKDGLPGNRLPSILMASDSILWIGSSNGLTQFNPKTGVSQVFGTGDGLPSPVFNDFCGTKSKDGQLLFGTPKGIVSVQPDQMLINPTPPTVLIKDILVFDQSIYDQGLTADERKRSQRPNDLSLAHDQNELTFEYVGLHYTAPEQNQYRHRLVPYDQQWIAAGSKRSARYTNLNPGSYTFEVLASNSDGVWATEPASVHIYISPPWWATWWAYLLYVFTIGSILYAIYQYQKKRWQLQTSLQLEQEKSQRLHEMDHFKTRFYTNITHEFRTPLTVIEGLADQISSNPKYKTQERLSLIKRNSQRLLQLINQLLELSKLESGRLTPAYIQDDIIRYMAYLIESFHSLAFEKQLRIAFFTELDRLEMDFDPEKLQQIIDNLVGNAIKFTPEYGKISVSATTEKSETRGANLIIKVVDTGSGIPADKRPHIFDRFYQADNSSIRKAEGSGLGLALVKELVDLMEGRIEVESSPEKGTIFRVALPIQNQAPREQVKMASIATNSPATSNIYQTRSTNGNALPLVLLVEDNPDVIYYLEACLENQYQVIKARNGREGIDKAIAEVPDLIITDVMMPEVDGFQLCKTLKTDERTSHIPIVMLTAKVMQEDKIAGLNRGADAYLIKPFQKQELLIRLKQLIALRQNLQLRYQADKTGTLEKEDPFLKKMQEVVLTHLDNADFSVMQLSRAMGMSRVQVHRKLKALTNLSTTEYVRNIRLQQARTLLQTTDLTIAEVGYQVGFKTPSHFSKAYAQLFGESPSVTRK